MRKNMKLSGPVPPPVGKKPRGRPRKHPIVDDSNGDGVVLPPLKKVGKKRVRNKKEVQKLSPETVQVTRKRKVVVSTKGTQTPGTSKTIVKVAGEVLAAHEVNYISKANDNKPGPSSSNPGPSSSNPGPSSSKAGPSSSNPGPSSSNPGPSSFNPGPSSSKAGPSSSNPGPSSSKAGPSSSNPGPSSSKQVYPKSEEEDDVYNVTGTTPLAVAAHLALLGESLSKIGERLKEAEGQSVTGSLAVLMDTLVCATGPLLCLTQQVPELNCVPQERLDRILNNIAYFIPGFK